MGLPLAECKLVIHQNSSARLGELRIIGLLIVELVVRQSLYQKSPEMLEELTK